MPIMDSTDINEEPGGGYYNEDGQLFNQFQEYSYPTAGEDFEGTTPEGGGEAIEIVTTTVDIPLFLVG